METQRQINTNDYWELEKLVFEPNGNGTEMVEYAYLINRLKGEIKKVRVN